MNYLRLVIAAFVCLALDCISVALPVGTDTDISEDSLTVVTTTVPPSVETDLPPSVHVETTASPVSELLNTIFQQTIYTRIESLLLDPGKKSDEKQKLVDSAVRNYHRQKMYSEDKTFGNSDNSHEEEEDISKSTGFWIRETNEGDKGTISIFDMSDESDESSGGPDYQTESYHIADLFGATTTPK